MRDRIARLREQVMSRHGSMLAGDCENPFVLDVALWRAARPERSVVQQRAAFLHEEVRLAEIEVPPLWALAGEHLPKASRNFGFVLDPTPDVARIRDGYGLTDAEIAQVRECVRCWTGRREHMFSGHQFVHVGELEGDRVAGRGGWGGSESTHVFWASGWSENHSIRDYAKVLRIGFAGIRGEAEALLAGTDFTDRDFPCKENFWKAVLSVCDAGILLGKRYAELAARLAEEADAVDERRRLQQMAEACRRVPEHGARTLREATQSLWLSHILTCGEDSINANSIGRLDQILQPYYAADLAAGRCTRDDALDLMEELACKLYLDYDVQAIVLGGVDREGGNAVNEMSRIILEATRNVEFVRDVSVRLSSESPPEFVDLCAELIAGGGGIPFMFNDDCFLHALSARGIPLEDARDYAPIGCIELTIPGKTNPHAVSAWMNATKCLELALFDGRDPRSGVQLGPRTGMLTDLSSYEELFGNYCRQLEFFTRRMVYLCNRGELAQRERGPLPCLSTLTDACIERGRDITNGGPLYDYHSVCFLGTANTADSLMAVKKLLFEEEAIDGAVLLEALKADFAGYESLRQMLLTRAPKYGNDCPEVDEIARVVDEHFIQLMDRFESPLDGRYFVHLFSFLCNISFGKMVAATPDGRKACEPLAYSLSAHQGRDERGVTAMLRSLSRLPHKEAAGATAAIVDLDPKLVAGEAGVSRLSQLIRTAMGMGVGQLQWNVTTVERLRQAQQDPERYGNVSVRVAGFSQMFKLINPELQEHIIARTKHRQ